MGHPQTSKSICSAAHCQYHSWSQALQGISILRSSWLWVIHKPTLHRSPFARPHTVIITVGHKHYRVSLSSDLRLSWLWVNHIKPLSSVALHIQQRLCRRELYAMGTIASWGGRNDPNGKWHQLMVLIHPYYSLTHGIYPWYCKWHLPVVL